ncbi:MAG: tRNA (adenosine(37)-N6)-threonylcarbamoyltransferase complex dimerization subunit type 1 TsaB [Planctomycetota bacterium]
MSTTLALTGSNLCGDAAFSAALARGGEVTVRSAPRGARGDLTQLCQELCASAGVAPSALDRLVLDVGPGSYTGLRVAVTFARMLQRFSGVEVEGVCSLALLARHAAASATAPVRTLLDARRGRLHTALHRHADGATRELEAARAAPTDEVLDALTPDVVLVAPTALAERLADERGLACVAAEGLTAAALLAEGLPRFPAPAEALEPRYLMASYAED